LSAGKLLGKDMALVVPMHAGGHRVTSFRAIYALIMGLTWLDMGVVGYCTLAEVPPTVKALILHLFRASLTETVILGFHYLGLEWCVTSVARDIVVHSTRTCDLFP
jgi:hypothetical protein